MKPITVAIIILFISCREPFNNENSFLNIDLHPPVLQNIEINRGDSLTITFDEPVLFSGNDYKCDPALPLEKWTTEENSIIFYFLEQQIPGKMYKFRSIVSDSKGNLLSFIFHYYGWNPERPPLLINEFNPEGSGNNPDTIELYAVGPGNTAGVTLYLGTADNFSEEYILPSLDILQGDYIIIHMRPEGTEGDISETKDKTASTGKLSSDLAWDLWVDGDKPISGKNGVISLYTNPFGEIIDAVAYSNRITADSEDYHGWTASTIGMIEELSFLSAWKNTDGFIRPEDAVNSEGTTGTRSIGRNSLSGDSNNKSDWHIVPTGEKSFGQANSDNVYIP
ncbi:MAG: hypothetical protein JEY91_14170 [Spirochaetaceae bacterium]|nr:hypothetical protein [Spirochaetaceae bacterium]